MPADVGGHIVGSSPIRRPLRAVLLDGSAEDREDFRFALRNHPAIDLVGEAESMSAALTWIESGAVDVLFTETRLGGQSLVGMCGRVRQAVKVIFVTDNPGDAAGAYEIDAVDYILKPLTSSRLSETIRRLLRIDWSRGDAIPPVSQSASMLIPFERGRKGVALDDINLIQACGNYTRLAYGEGRSEVVMRSLTKWESILPRPPFLRVHRNAIVHVARVRGLEDGGSGPVLRMSDGELVPVSRRCFREVHQNLFASGAQALAS